MPRPFLIFLNACILLAVSCQNDAPSSGSPNAKTIETSPVASPKQLGGQWFCMDFCSRAGQYGSVLGAINNAHVPYAFAFEVNPERPDSIVMHNGFERWALKARYNVDTVELKDARPGKSIFLVFDSKGDRSITMFDGTTGSTQLDKFQKSKASTPDAYGAFITALNHQLFGGTMAPVGKNAKVANDVQFKSGGFLEGLKEFDRYEVCTAGDCFVTGSTLDVISLSNSKNKDEFKLFGFKYSKQNDTLTLFNLINNKPDEKGAFTVGTPAYKFSRKVQY
jgi:hypothetical protein